jgi:hypothetical protein
VKVRVTDVVAIAETVRSDTLAGGLIVAVDESPEHTTRAGAIISIADVVAMRLTRESVDCIGGNSFSCTVRRSVK